PLVVTDPNNDDAVEHTKLTEHPGVQHFILSTLFGLFRASTPLIAAGQVAATDEPAPALQPAFYLRVTGVTSLIVTDTLGNSTFVLIDDPTDLPSDGP